MGPTPCITLQSKDTNAPQQPRPKQCQSVTSSRRRGLHGGSVLVRCPVRCRGVAVAALQPTPLLTPPPYPSERPSGCAAVPWLAAAVRRRGRPHRDHTEYCPRHTPHVPACDAAWFVSARAAQGACPHPC